MIVGYHLNDPEIEPVQLLHAYFAEPSWWQYSNFLRLLALRKQNWAVARLGGGYYYRYLHADPQRWFHVASSFVPGSGVDDTAGGYNGGGLDDNSSGISSIFNGAADFHVGRTDSAATAFDGFIMELRIWTRVLTYDEMATHAYSRLLDNATRLADADLLGYWPLTGSLTPRGNDFRDQGAQALGNDLTAVNGATLVNDEPPWLCTDNNVASAAVGSPSSLTPEATDGSIAFTTRTQIARNIS